MPEPTNHQDIPSSSSSAANTSPLLKKVRNWLISTAIILVVSIFVELVFEEISIEHLKNTNKSFVEGIEAVDPFRLAVIFYNFLLYGVIPEPAYIHLMGHSFLPPSPPALLQPALHALNEYLQPKKFPWQVSCLLRFIPGVFYTAWAIISSGLVSTITAAIALFLGFMVSRSNIKEGGGLKIWSLMFAPLIGCVFLWLLLKLMWLASLLFGGLLVGAEMVVVFSFVPTVLLAVGKKIEHDVTSKITKRLIGPE